MMRSSCGSNDHPDSVLFIQIFKLICTYLFVKPPKGSNITGGELLSSLFSIKDLKTQEDKRKLFHQAAIDNIIDQGSDCPDIMDIFSYYYDHDYAGITVTNYSVLAYIRGYVARKATRFTKCLNCLSSLKSEISDSRDILIDKLSHGYLIKPSEKLFNLISTMEAATLNVLNEGLCSEVLFNICSKLEQIESLQLVRCDLHAHDLTSSLVNFFLITRVHFICSRSNTIDNAKKEKSKLHRKSAKLI